METQGHYTPSNGDNPITEAKLAFVDFGRDVASGTTYFFSHFKEVTKNEWEKIKKSDMWHLVGVLTLVAFLCFANTLLTNGFTVPVGGDFRLQGMAFIYNGYDDWHYFFRTGIFPMWDTSGALGLDNITGYSFYYLFDPFFLALLIWPRAWLNQIQAILMIAKIVLAGVFFYQYLGSFHITKATRKIGAIAYAFCGWGWFYLWFFHMMEAATFLPLMLLGVEKIIKKKDPRLMIVAMFLMGATNYQYLAIFTVFCFFYAMFRFFQTMKERNAEEGWQVLGLGFVAFLTGVMVCAFIIIPCFLSIKSMPRIASSTNSFLAQLQAADGLGAKLTLCFKWPTNYSYRHMYPLESLLFITNSCFQEPLTHLPGGGYDNAGSSIYVSAPILLMIIPSLLDSWKNKQWSQTIAFVLLTIALEIPVTYYAAGMFSSVPYGRWEVFVTAMLIVFVCSHLDDLRFMPKWYIDVSAGAVALLTFFVAKSCFDFANSGDYSSLMLLNTQTTILGMNVNMYHAALWFQGIWDVACYLFIRFTCRQRVFRKQLFYIIAIESIISGNVGVVGQGIASYYSSVFSGRSAYNEQTKIVQNLNSWDPSFFRLMNANTSSSSNFDPNLAMAEGYNGLGTFNSMYNFDSEYFFRWSRIDFNNNSYMLAYKEKRYNLDTFLGVKYYLLPKEDVNVPYGFIDVTTDPTCSDSLKNCLYSASNPKANFKLYKNTNFIDRAFAFDDFMSSSSMYSMIDGENINEINYLKKAIVDSTYYKDNQAAFADFNFKDYLVSSSDGKSDSDFNVTSDSALNGISTYRYAKWDYDVLPTNSGILRTLASDMSDAEYSDAHREEIEKDIQNNPNTQYIVNNNHTTQDGKTVYQKALTPENCFFAEGDVIKTGSRAASALNAVGAYYSKVVLDKNDSSGNPLPIMAQDASSRGGAYVSIGSTPGDSSSSYNIDYYIYGYDTATKSYKYLTHDDNNYIKQSTQKRARGFYVDEPVYRIVGLIKTSNFKSLSVSSLSYEYNDEYQADINALKANQVMVHYDDSTVNTLRYTSNYAKKKIVVLNTLYSTGFSLKKTTKDSSGKEKTENVPIFKANGGFIGYIAGAGEENYTLSYYTQGLKAGLALTTVGFTLQGAIYLLWLSKNKLRMDYERMNKMVSLKKL
ncbi:MAG: YfhO family protein [Bacilli bacterium]|jgi:uncharacterized membrane protein YfhO|nr:YfhO family protein [Bacilli bacterium]